MRVGFLAATAAFTACGLELVGAPATMVREPETDARVATAPDAPSSQPTDAALPFPDVQVPDVATDPPMLDAGDTLPNPDEVAVAYGATGNGIVIFDLTANTSKAGSFANCPALEEVAVSSAGEVWVTSKAGDELLTWNDARGCTSVHKASNSVYPIALTFVPSGLLGAAETMAGYVGKDYVRIDPVSHLPVIIDANALGEFAPSGDLVAVGTKGYFGAKLTAAPCSGACIVEVDLRTGRPLRVLVSMPSGQGVFGLGQGHGGLVVLNGKGAQRYDLKTGSFSAMSGPSNAVYNGGGAAPYPH
jgi:hypothetical protein